MEKKDYFGQIDLAYGTMTGSQLEDRLRELVRAGGEEYGRQSGFYAGLLSELGGYYRGQGRFEESAQQFLLARKILEELGKTGSPDYATVLNNLAGTYRLMKRYDDAERLLSESLELYRATLGERHILYASGLNNLALVCLDRKDYERAAGFLEQAAAILELQPECADELASSLSNLVSLYRNMGQTERARQMLQRVISMFEEQLGTRTPHYHAALNTLGLCFYQEGQYEEARTWLLRARETARTLYGSSHREYQAIQNHLDLVERALEDRT